MKENRQETVKWEMREGERVKRGEERRKERKGERRGVFRGRLLLRFTNLFLQQILWDPLTEVNRL